MANDLKGPPAKVTGRQYGSVEDLMRGEGVPQEIQEGVRKLKQATQVVDCLARLRQAVGLTQEEMAKAIGVTQSAISKLEGKKDEDLTLGEIQAYARATDQRIGLAVGKPLTHVEAVKCHAVAIKQRLDALAQIANKHEELEKDIQGFFGEAFFNILNILAECGDKLPTSGKNGGIRIEIFQRPNPKPLKRKPRGAIPVGND